MSVCESVITAFQMVGVKILLYFNVLGNGVVVHVPCLFEEEKVNSQEGRTGLQGWKDRLLISNKAHLTFDFHKMLDVNQEERRGAKKFVVCILTICNAFFIST